MRELSRQSPQGPNFDLHGKRSASGSMPCAGQKVGEMAEKTGVPPTPRILRNRCIAIDGNALWIGRYGKCSCTQRVQNRVRPLPCGRAFRGGRKAHRTRQLRCAQAILYQRLHYPINSDSKQGSNALCRACFAFGDAINQGAFIPSRSVTTFCACQDGKRCVRLIDRPEPTGR